jgi:GNAT superfamily N-acetyltransferase
MTVRIRKATDDDARGVVAILRETNPHFPATAETWRHRRRTVPERARALWLTAESDGDVVGRGEAGLNWLAGTDTAYVGVSVAGTARGRGIGAALYDRLAEHVRSLGAQRVLSMFFETDEGVRFATRRGFREVRAEVPSAVDPRTVGLPLPGGVTVVPVRDVPPEQVHEVDEVATRDVPMTEPVEELRYEEWLAALWNRPTFTRDGSFAAIVDDRAVAVALVFADVEGGQALNAFTGTLPAYRGRGLALACKLASMRWAAAAGIASVITTNDETNAPMLALNRKLGYRPFGRVVEYLGEGDVR